MPRATTATPFTATTNHVLDLITRHPAAMDVFDAGFSSGYRVGFTAAELKQREHERAVDEHIRRDMKHTQGWAAVERRRNEPRPTSRVPSYEECMASWGVAS